MTSIRRTSWTLLGRPIAGDLIRVPGGAVVPIHLGRGEDLQVSDAYWARELGAAASMVASVLESEHGMPAPLPSLVEEERDVYRDVLTRVASAESMPDIAAAIREARLALEHWAGRS